VADADRRELDHVRVNFFAVAQAIECEGARVEAADLGAERADEFEQLWIGLLNPRGNELDHADRGAVVDNRRKQRAVIGNPQRRTGAEDFPGGSFARPGRSRRLHYLPQTLLIGAPSSVDAQDALVGIEVPILGGGPILGATNGAERGEEGGFGLAAVKEDSADVPVEAEQFQLPLRARVLATRLSHRSSLVTLTRIN
jgi:hypothetical protein